MSPLFRERASLWWGRRRVRYSVRLFVLVAMVALVAWRIDWSAMATALHPEHPWVLAGAITANTVSVVFKGIAWKGVVDSLPEVTRRVRLRSVVSPLFVGFLFNTVLAARIGEIVKVILLRRRLRAGGTDISGTTLLGTVVVENLVSTVMWVLFVMAIGVFLPLPTYAWVATTVLGVLCLMLIAIALVSERRHKDQKNGSRGLIGRLGGLANRLWVAVERSHDALRGVRSTFVVSGASLGTWLWQITGIYLTLWAFGLERVGWGGAGLLLVTVTLAQAFPVLPGNVGLFQAAAAIPLTTSYGVGAADAIAFSVVLQFTEVVVGVGLGFVFLLIEGVGFDQLRRQARSGGFSATLPEVHIAGETSRATTSD